MGQNKLSQLCITFMVTDSENILQMISLTFY